MMHLICTREHGMSLQTSTSKIKEETGRQRRAGRGEERRGRRTQGRGEYVREYLHYYCCFLPLQAEGRSERICTRMSRGGV